jgi:VIT1/CCC1 family predicted Fe2+/Mn2+ transporter
MTQQRQAIQKPATIANTIIDQIYRKITDLGKFLGSLIGIIIVAFIPDKLRIWEAALLIWSFSLVFWAVGWAIGTFLLDKKKPTHL